MQVHFWGTRGSIPVSLKHSEVRAKIFKAVRETRHHKLHNDSEILAFIDKHLPFDVRGTCGGNTSCVEIRGAGETLICDAGTGLRDFGQHIISDGDSRRDKVNIFISHLHWDHIQGFPFFLPAYLPGFTINIFGCHADIEKAFVKQQASPFFPVPLKDMKADIRFTVMQEGKDYHIGGVKVTAVQQQHPGYSYGYRFEKAGHVVVYSTDAEHPDERISSEYYFTKFIKNSDLLIYDSQFCYADAIIFKRHWGHSANILGVEQAVKGNVKRLVLFHNDPSSSDEMLEKLLEDTRRYLNFCDPKSSLSVYLAYDGLEIEL